MKGPRGPFSSPRLTYVSLPPDYEPLQPLVGHPGCVFSLCRRDTIPGRNRGRTLVMHVDEANLIREMKRLWTTPASRRWIFSDLFSRVSKTWRGPFFLSYNDVFQSLCESVFSTSFGLDVKCQKKRGLLCEARFNVSGFIIFRTSGRGQEALCLSICR